MCRFTLVSVQVCSIYDERNNKTSIIWFTLNPNIGLLTVLLYKYVIQPIECKIDQFRAIIKRVLYFFCKYNVRMCDNVGKLHFSQFGINV